MVASRRKGVKPARQTPLDTVRAQADASIDEYLTHLRVERRLAAHTVENYARDLSRLAAFAETGGTTPLALDRPALERFVRLLLSEGLSPRSVARMVAATRGYYKHAVREGQLADSPAGDLRAARSWPALPK